MNQSMAQNATKVIAHRGAWKEFGLPENSIASLGKAIEIGCYGSEFDVRRTKDGVLVISHDPTYYGDTIELKNYAELNKLKLTNGEDLPTLLEYFKKGTSNNSNTLLICEIKQAITDNNLDKIVTQEVMQMVQKLGISNKIVFISFRFEILEWVKQFDQNAIVLYLEGDRDNNAVVAAKFNGINYHFDNYLQKPDISKDAIKNGLMVGSWTVNEEGTLKDLMALGVEYITTNFPSRFLQIVSK
jgi:glycerophosphoryl diester phosphodiesterase